MPDKVPCLQASADSRSVHKRLATSHLARLKAFVELDIRELSGEKVKVTTNAATPTCSPFFAITPVYCGKGTWDLKTWNLTHVPSGLAASRGKTGRNGKKLLRVIAAVLCRVDIDWSESDATRLRLSDIPPTITDWVRSC